MLRGAAVPQLGLQSFGFAAATPDVLALFPVGRPFRLRATALDYGGAALASDVWLIVQ